MKYKRSILNKLLISILLLPLLMLVDAQATESTKKKSSINKRPNILLIVADDIGYTDIGRFGGEISTPHLDELAKSGVTLTSFYTAPSCSPTRAMLLSGTDNHVAGLGNMAEDLAPNQKGVKGYEGHLNFDVVSVASLLKDAGYHTYMTGKWHLGKKEALSPAARGFEKSYALVSGGAAHLNDVPNVGPGKAIYREDGKLSQLPDDFYSTRFHTNKLIEYIQADKDDEQPFFAYLAYTAPHWPLQAPEKSVAKYRGRYDKGYDELYAKRKSRLENMGLGIENAEGWPKLDDEPNWDKLSEQQKKIESRKMEIYAAMVDDLDRYVGRLLKYLEQIGERENTFIIFMSDNGAEGHHLEQGWPQLADWVTKCCDNSYENIGKQNSYIWYGPNWGRAGSGPFKHFKGFVSEGGIRVPAFVNYAGIKRQGQVSDTFISVKDVMPTLLDLAATTHPGDSYKGRKIKPMQGKSIVPFLLNERANVHLDNYIMGWELFGKRAIRQGDWKIVLQPKPYGTANWQLFNLSKDPSEQTDLSLRFPDKLKNMIVLWEDYAIKNNVIIPDWVSGY